MDKKKIQADFKRLESALLTTPLPHADGRSHIGSPSEFMWMHESEEGIHFKHHDTRNYIVLAPDGTLKIPTGGPFQRGTFERPEDSEREKAPNPPNHIPFDEAQCGGAFDGSRVTSDADPGL